MVFHINFSMDDGCDTSQRAKPSRSNVGFNADIGDMCFIMLEYIKDAMKVLLLFNYYSSTIKRPFTHSIQI